MVSTGSASRIVTALMPVIISPRVVTISWYIFGEVIFRGKMSGEMFGGCPENAREVLCFGGHRRTLFPVQEIHLTARTILTLSQLVRRTS